MAVMKQIATTGDLYAQDPNTATSLTGAPSHTGDECHAINWRQVNQNVRRLQARIVKATHMLRNRVWQQTFEWLERLEGKLSWAVLRGLEVSNDLRLPDQNIEFFPASNTR